MNTINIHRKIILTLCLTYLVFGFACNGDDPNAPEPGSGTEGFDVAKIARWDGSRWHSLGQGVTNSQEFQNDPVWVNDLIVDDGLVYVGGIFERANNTTVNSIASWNGSDWQGFGFTDLPGVFVAFTGFQGAPGFVNAMVISSAVSFGKTLYVGGSFKATANGLIDLTESNNIVQFYLQVGTWDRLAQGVNGTVNALAVNASGLFVGGSFSAATDNNGAQVGSTNLIARWSIQNTAWASVGGGIVGSEVNALAVDNSDVYVGGAFSQAGSVAAFNIAKWAGNHWESMGDGLEGTVYDIAVTGGNVYAAGQFFTQDFENFYLLARWDGSAWSFLGDAISPAGQETNYLIRGLSLAVNGNQIYLGGRFQSMDGGTVNHVARLNGNTWEDLTGGVHNIGGELLSGVKALAVSGNDVYVGGTFTAVGQ